LFESRRHFVYTIHSFLVCAQTYVPHAIIRSSLCLFIYAACYLFAYITQNLLMSAFTHTCRYTCTYIHSLTISQRLDLFIVTAQNHLFVCTHLSLCFQIYICICNLMTCKYVYKCVYGCSVVTRCLGRFVLVVRLCTHIRKLNM